MAKILLVDDDADLILMISSFLAREHHIVETANNGDDAKHLLTISNYDVIVLDWNMPGMSGIDLCKWYRKAGSAPIIMLTGRTAVAQKEEGLDSGADDYLTKPFSMKELSARIRALLRRPVNHVMELSIGEYSLHPPTLTVKRAGKEFQLPPREFALLEFLARHPQEIFKGDALMTRVWRSDSETTTDSLRTCVKQIRKRLDDDKVIETVAGAGYRLGYQSNSSSNEEQANQSKSEPPKT
jgi:DNA-binding response OmpR family regulator